jgi:hypothetical protein
MIVDPASSICVCVADVEYCNQKTADDGVNIFFSMLTIDYEHPHAGCDSTVRRIWIGSVSDGNQLQLVTANMYHR